MVEAQDYAEEESTEEVVLTRWDRTKKYIEMCMATKKLYMFVMALLCGTTGTLAVGEITETNPLREAAIEVGLIDPIDMEAEEELVESMLAEPGSDHTHPHEHPPEAHIVTQTDLDETLLVVDILADTVAEKDHSHPEVSHKHGDHIHANHTHPAGGLSEDGTKKLIADALLDAIPPDHRKLH